MLLFEKRFHFYIHFCRWTKSRRKVVVTRQHCAVIKHYRKAIITEKKNRLHVCRPPEIKKTRAAHTLCCALQICARAIKTNEIENQFASVRGTKARDGGRANIFRSAFKKTNSFGFVWRAAAFHGTQIKISSSSRTGSRSIIVSDLNVKDHLARRAS